LGYAVPLDYAGPLHLDRSGVEMRLHAFLPTWIAGFNWTEEDYPGLRFSTGQKVVARDAYLNMYGGMDWRLADHWFLSGVLLGETLFSFQGDKSSYTSSTGGDPGWEADLYYRDLEAGKDGIITGISAHASGGYPVAFGQAKFQWGAGTVAYASFRRALFLSCALDYKRRLQAFSQTSEGIEIYGAIPLGWNLGSAGGKGVYLNTLLPGLEITRTVRSYDYGLGSAARLTADQARPLFLERKLYSGPFPYGTELRRGNGHELIFFLTLKTLGFYHQEAHLKAGVHYPDADLSAPPEYSLSLAL
jgi:hypothetical protein